MQNERRTFTRTAKSGKVDRPSPRFRSGSEALPPDERGARDAPTKRHSATLHEDEGADPLRLLTGRALGSVGSIQRVSRLTATELSTELGLSRSAASRLRAAFLLGQRVERDRQPLGEACTSPEAVARLLLPRTRGLDRECFFAVYLDGRHRSIDVRTVSIGTLTSSLVHPREVFGPALRMAAGALVVAHNHPSGDPSPSAEDLRVTKRLAAAGELLGVPLIDHVVLGDGDFVSLRRRGALPGVGKEASSPRARSRAAGDVGGGSTGAGIAGAASSG